MPDDVFRRRHHQIALIVGALVLALVTAASTLPPGSQPSMEHHGWTVSYASPEAKTPVVTRRPDGDAAFVLGRGESIHPTLPPSGLTISSQADFVVTEPGDHQFGATFQGGTLQISLVSPALSQPVTVTKTASSPTTATLPWTALEPSTVKLQYFFIRDGDRPVRFRPMWERRGDVPIGREPVPTRLLRVPMAASESTRRGEAAFRGRRLLGQHGCINCHAHPSAESAVLEQHAPVLAGIGGRVGSDWLERWIADPQLMKPGSSMPDVITDKEADRGIAKDIAAYLASLPAEPEPVLDVAGSIDDGRSLYERVGCVACHGPVDERSDAPVPVLAAPFGDVRSKWTTNALASFLLDPLELHPSGRMPSLALEEHEAASIAAYLADRWGVPKSEPQSDAAAIRRGKAAFVSQGCASCHEVDGAGASRRARPLARLRVKRGCLNARDSRSPRYSLSEADRSALAAAIDESARWTDAPCPLDQAHLTMETMNCTSCHEWNGEGGVHPTVDEYFVLEEEEADLGDEGRLPPRLDGVGWKLNTDWIDEVLLENGRARPYMSARMPQFGEEHVDELSAHLAKLAGLTPGRDVRWPERTDDLVDAGRQLVGDGGINCISCHVFGDAPRAGTPGPDLTAFASRIRYEWWRRFVRNPDHFKPGTRMLSPFATGRGTVTSILAGDPTKQTDALWSYFTLGEEMLEPDGLPQAGGLMLRVGSKPRIFRTFLPNAGNRAVAVGFPAGVHFGFDAERIRLTEVWQGAFLDAAGAWQARGGTVTDGRGQVVYAAQRGPDVVVSIDQPQNPTPGREGGYRFRGYQLDADGTPTFRYNIASDAGTAHVRDRTTPDPRGSLLERRFTIENVPPSHAVWIKLDDKTTLRELVQGEIRDEGSAWLQVTPDVTGTVEIVMEVAR